MSTPATITRPVRTGIQGGAAYAVVEGINAFHIMNMDERQYAISVVLLTAVFAWLQVIVENFLGKGLLRNPDDTDE